MDNVLIPILREVLPVLFAEDILGVQPMAECVGEMFKFEYVEGYQKHARFGNVAYFIAYGYQVFDGKDWCPVHLFVERYPDLHYAEIANVSNRWPINT